MQKDNFSLILVSLAFLTFVGSVWYAFDTGKEGSPATPAIKGESGSNTLPARVPPAGWKEHRNDTYKFSLLYPEGLTMKEFKEAGKAMTVTFEDVAGGKEFQMFIVPYANAEITPERFKSDIPSGVKENETDVTISGAKGKQFFSRDRLLGDTREIWFVHGGFLYEVTTHKSLDAWIQNILTTWRFFPEENKK